MRETRISLPELGLVAGTRAMLGAGIGLLLSLHCSESTRKAIGWTLFTAGALTTIPLAFEILGGGRLSDPARRLERGDWWGRSPESHERPQEEAEMARAGGI
jgi:hypothetical protein